MRDVSYSVVSGTRPTCQAVLPSNGIVFGRSNLAAKWKACCEQPGKEPSAYQHGSNAPHQLRPGHRDLILIAAGLVRQRFVLEFRAGVLKPAGNCSLLSI